MSDLFQSGGRNETDLSADSKSGKKWQILQ